MHDIKIRELEFDINDLEVSESFTNEKGNEDFDAYCKVRLYIIVFSLELALFHSIFHVSLLNKCIGHTSHGVPLQIIGVKDSLFY